MIFPGSHLVGSHLFVPKSISIMLCSISSSCCYKRSYVSKLLPVEEQFGLRPGYPLIVWASETFGARPDFIASLITSSVSDFHHSANETTRVLIF